MKFACCLNMTFKYKPRLVCMSVNGESLVAENDYLADGFVQENVVQAMMIICDDFLMLERFKADAILYREK